MTLCDSPQTGDKRISDNNRMKTSAESLGYAYGPDTIESFVTVIGRYSFSLSRAGGRPVYSLAATVGGVGLSHQEVSKDEWFKTLVAELDSLLASG